MVNITMSVADTYIGNADGLSINSNGDVTIPATVHTKEITESWATYALDNDTKFAFAFFIWKSLCHTRFATALIGFIGYALIDIFDLYIKFIRYHLLLS